ncbi:MAG: DUF2062 domain-containing protein [Planctomycetota bacterium]|jgi:uncharacterized protein (TIGR03546 family)
MITRKIGSLIRGKLTKNQVFLASMLGCLLGFVPGFILPGDLGGGFLQSPGLILGLLFLVLILNCDLTLFGFTLVLAKIASLVLLPVSFFIGEILLEGPTGSLFAMMINAPVLAWFGLEYYATTGGLVLGAVLGVVWGTMLCKGLNAFRRVMAEKEENSEFYQKHSGKRSTRFMTWLLIGKKSKKSYRELFDAQKKGLPFRVTGVVLTVLIIVGLWTLQSFFAGNAVRSAVQSGLESNNGATVDLAALNLDLAAAQVSLEGLAMADPNNLSQDVFRADKMEFALDTTALLRRRLVISDLTSIGAKSGASRSEPGELIPVAPPPPPPPAPEGEESKTIEEYIEEAKTWKERLQQANRWLETVFGESEEEAPEDREERIEYEIQEYGRAKVAASHLIQGSPTLLVRKLTMEDVTMEDGEVIDIHGANLSSHPHLVAEPASLSIKSRQDRFGLELQLVAGEGGAADTKFFRKGIPVDDFAGQIKTAGAPPLQGGTMDLALDGRLESKGGSVWLDLPLNVTLHDTTLALPSMKPSKVDNFSLPLGLRGPLASPRITIDDDALVNALVASGQQELANQVRDRATKVLGDKIPEDLGDKAAEELKKALPGGLFGGKKKK